MTVNLANVIVEPPSGREKAVLLDHLDYSQAVILKGRPIPWADPMAYANFIGQAQGLLKPDVALLHLDRFYAHRVATDQRLQDAMRARSRTGYALRTLLADDDTLEHALGIATTFSQTQREPVVLQVPSPMQWLARTHHFSGASGLGGLDADDAENASMYVADWLRKFSALPLAGLLLDDRTLPGMEAVPPVDLGTYSPVVNVADNYRWTLGMRRQGTLHVPQVESAGAVLDPGFWIEDQVAPPAGVFFMAELPAAAVPEEVISRIASFT